MSVEDADSKKTPDLILELVLRLFGEPFRYKNFDTESPYNREAAAWAKTQNEYVFPLDHRSIRDRIENSGLPIRPTQEPEKSGIEIVETGIEVVRRPPPQPDTGIVFLD